MKTFMSIDEVFANYPNEWVLLDELETHDNLTVQGGNVVGHDLDRSAMEAMAIEMRLASCVIVCTKRNDPFGRDYAVSPITSFEEIREVVAKNE